MTKSYRFLPLFAAAMAAAQGGFSYTSSAGDVTLNARSGLVEIPAAGSSVYKFKLRTGVTARSRKDGIVISASEVTGELTSRGKDTVIRHAVATGGVRLVKTGSGSTNTITGARADYTDQGSSALVVMSGGVRITSNSSVKRQMWVITGPSGQAVLDPAARKGAGLRTVTMSGGARVDLTQPRGGNVTATGRQLTLDQAARTVTLSGGVTVKGSGASSFGTLQNAQRAVLRLNEKGEVVASEVSS